MFSPTEPIVGHDAESRSMSSPAHLSIVLDINPTIWHSSADESFSLSIFLPQLYAFLNAHLAAKYENTLAVFAAFPAKRQVILSYVINASFLQHHALLYIWLARRCRCPRR